jgi:hypothetical protein
LADPSTFIDDLQAAVPAELDPEIAKDIHNQLLEVFTQAGKLYQQAILASLAHQKGELDEAPPRTSSWKPARS